MFPVPRQRRERIVGAIIDTVERSLLLFENFAHFPVDVLEVCFIKESPAYAGLIGDNYGQEPGLVDFSNGFEAPRKNFDLVKVPGIADILVDRSISVQEDCSFSHWQYLRLAAKTSAADIPSRQR